MATDDSLDALVMAQLGALVLGLPLLVSLGVGAGLLGAFVGALAGAVGWFWWLRSRRSPGKETR
jgi:ABC-type transporter Mla maintaining outer membrane lipid asymmetry permease subunit MlaE